MIHPPTRGTKQTNAGGCAAAALVEPAKDTGSPLGPPGCFASRYARRTCGAPWTPEPLRPLSRKTRAAPACLAPNADTTRPTTRSTSLQPKSPRFEGIDGYPAGASRMTDRVLGRLSHHRPIHPQHPQAPSSAALRPATQFVFFGATFRLGLPPPERLAIRIIVSGGRMPTIVCVAARAT